LIEVIFVAHTPQEAYKLAEDKYQNGFKVLSAKQIYNETEDNFSYEIKISVDETKYFDLNSKKTIEKVSSFFIKRGVINSWIEKLSKRVENTEIVKSEKDFIVHIIQKINKLIKIKKEKPTKHKVKVFVGPTGVGKTTTVAKLAYRYSNQGHKVSLINLDAFKAGAFEQLAFFAKRMKLPHYTVRTFGRFKKVFLSSQDSDIILVDTTGMSPYDSTRLIKTLRYINVDKEQDIEVYLVISATIKYEDLQDIYQNFSALKIDSVILTKFDETKYIGTIISYLLEHSLPLSYFTIGQNVPDDLIVANKKFLLQKFIGKL
jgi:flagellar biosynthesis protein FlhF